MSLYDKMYCMNCNHRRHWHNGTHLKGHRTICRKTGCKCLRFLEVAENQAFIELVQLGQEMETHEADKNS